jgi:hypothetical protein
MKTIVAIAAVCILAAGCATYRLVPNEVYEGQEVIYVEGYEAVSENYLISEKGGLTVSVFGYLTDDVLAMNVFFGNACDEQINVLPDMIYVEGISEEGNIPIKVWEANAYIRKIRKIQNAALILQAIGGALEASNAGRSTTSTYGSYYGSTGYGSYSGTYSGYSTTYDYSKVAEANARNSAAIAAQARDNADNIEYLNAVLLKRHTLMPGTYISGAVYCEKKKFPFYKIKVPFGQRSFNFSLKLIEES